MSPKSPNSSHFDISTYLSKSAPGQLAPKRLWQKTILKILSQGETIPCPFLVSLLIEEIRPNSQDTQEKSGEEYSEAIKGIIRERRHLDPIFEKALHWLSGLPIGSLPENLAFVLIRLGENLALPQLEISPGEIRQLQPHRLPLENGTRPTGTYESPPWGPATLDVMASPRLGLDNGDLALLESGGTQWSASERKWFMEVLASKQWFQQWRKKSPLPGLLGISLVWESGSNPENQQEGGLETLVPKGTLDNLLPSELIWVGESTNLFSWKWSQGELLYFGREHSNTLRPSLCWNLVWDPKALDWQHWPHGCPGRMGAMALGWILSVLEAVQLDRGPWDFATRWILPETAGNNWEESVKPLKHIVKSLWPFSSQWEKHPEPGSATGNRSMTTHQCWIHFGSPKIQSNAIHLHPQRAHGDENPPNLTLVGTPQSPEDWLEWDERVMHDLAHFWIATGEAHEAN